MDLDKLINNRDKLNNFIDTLSYAENGVWLLRKLYGIRNHLNEEIKTQEVILEQDDVIEVPSWTKNDEYYTLSKDSIQYILHKYKEDKDGSFHRYSYAYIPHKDGYIEFCVRMLGKDKYKDRIYTSSSYYKTRKSMFSYYSKEYGKGRRYPKQFDEHVKFIIEEFNKLEEVNGNFKPL